MIEKIVPFRHDPVDTRIIYMAVTDGREPTPTDWVPVYRDIHNGQYVIRAMVTEDGPATWVRIENHVRQVVAAGQPVGVVMTRPTQTGPHRQPNVAPSRRRR